MTGSFMSPKVKLMLPPFLSNYFMKKKDYDDMERRVRAFRAANNVRMAIHPVLVTTFGLANNQYSSFFQNTVTLKDLFK